MIGVDANAFGDKTLRQINLDKQEQKFDDKTEPFAFRKQILLLVLNISSRLDRNKPILNNAGCVSF